MENVNEVTFEDISWFKTKRDFQLERFNELIKSDGTDERITECYNNLLKINKQLKLMEDVLIVQTLLKNKQNA